MTHSGCRCSWWRENIRGNREEQKKGEWRREDKRKGKEKVIEERRMVERREEEK